MFETGAPNTGDAAGSAWDRRRAAMRAEIVAAAWELCREHGLAALSMRDLAARVGLRAPSLYSYVDGKHAVHDAMFADGQRALLAHLGTDPAFHDRSVSVDRQRVRAGVNGFFRFCVDDPIRYQLLFQRTIPGFEPSPASYALAVEALDAIRAVLERAGVTDPSHVDLLTALVTGLADQQLSNDPGGDRWERLVDDAVDMYCDHVGLT